MKSRKVSRFLLFPSELQTSGGCMNANSRCGGIYEKTLCKIKFHKVFMPKDIQKEQSAELLLLFLFCSNRPHQTIVSVDQRQKQGGAFMEEPGNTWMDVGRRRGELWAETRRDLHPGWRLKVLCRFEAEAGSVSAPHLRRSCS